MEPRTGVSVWGGVELGLVSAATVPVAHSYGLPVNVYGLSTNAHTLDIQSGYERALNSIVPALAGADELSGMIVAYEPVWAIGTGKTATPDQAQEVHRFIRDWMEKAGGNAIAKSLRILYGGSVKPNNVAGLMTMEDIDGALVGGASLKAEDFDVFVPNAQTQGTMAVMMQQFREQGNTQQAISHDIADTVDLVKLAGEALEGGAGLGDVARCRAGPAGRKRIIRGFHRDTARRGESACP